MHKHLSKINKSKVAKFYYKRLDDVPCSSTKTAILEDRLYSSHSLDLGQCKSMRRIQEYALPALQNNNGFFLDYVFFFGGGGRHW